MRILSFAGACLALFVTWPFLTGALVAQVAGGAPFITQFLISKLGLCLAIAALASAMGVWRPIGFVAPRGLRGCLSTLPLWGVLALMFVSQGELAVTDAATVLLIFIPLALATSFSEEVLTRGGIWAAMRRFGDWPAILISSLVFGGVHLAGLLTDYPAVLILAQAVWAFSIGLVFAATRIASGSIWAPILAHAVFNAFTFSINGWGEDQGPMSAGDVSPEQVAFSMLVIAFILAIWGSVACWLALRAERKRETPEAASPVPA